MFDTYGWTTGWILRRNDGFFYVELFETHETMLWIICRAAISFQVSSTSRVNAFHASIMTVHLDGGRMYARGAICWHSPTAAMFYTWSNLIATP